jgi:hypothetical protein
MAEKLRQVIEAEGDEVAHLHLWRLGPGHLDAIVSVIAEQAHGSAYYRSRLTSFSSLSLLTIEVQQCPKLLRVRTLMT